jgi:protein tyrosine phosphatase (PTP) superfamily phosphohydrolase (DUF442 family)
MSRTAWHLTLTLLCLVFAGFQPDDRDAPARPAAPPAAETRIEAKGLHNVYRITDRLYSGSAPEGETGFESLQKLGIRTVISVDGARPDVVTAHRFGLRYVHIPFGYDGIPRQQVLRLAKAVRDLTGPFYIHCHHGKHRGPTAAAAVRLCLDERCTVEQALAEMRRAGTDPHYTGLYDVPKTFVRPTPDDLDRIQDNFPEVAAVSDLAQCMVEIDRRWENLKLVKAAGWRTPREHPDLDPPHEALILVEQFREASRLDQVQKRSTELHRLLTEAETKALKLEAMLRQSEATKMAEQAFRDAEASCTHCHARHRDLPQRP